MHGNKGRRPRHAILYEQVKNVVTFLERYAEAHGIPQLAAPCGQADVPPTYLPASHNKQAVYAHYKMCTAVGERVLGVFNPLKVCHTKIDRMRSMGVCRLNSVVCCRMATKLPRKLPNAFLYAKMKSFRGVHIQLLAEIGG